MRKAASPVARLLLISNGHGEDLIGSVLAARLVGRGFAVSALPLVGVGEAYAAAGIPVEIEGVNLPSGGFVRHGLRHLLVDALHGGFSLTKRQIRALKMASRRADLTVCVGDCLLILAARFFGRLPLVFLPTAKSDYINPHWPIEVRLMRRYCRMVFPRDALTAASLSRRGVAASFAGNLMMDALEFKGPDLASPAGVRTIALLPGSRAEAYGNMGEIADTVLALEEEAGSGECFRHLAAMAGGLDFEGFSGCLRPRGWLPAAAAPGERERGITGHLVYGAGEAAVRITFIQGRFADVLAACDVVLGLAGTANEQAAGLGKPIVTFPGRGPQITPGFVAAQSRLLGEAIAVVEREPRAAARELLDILRDDERRARMARAGRERMGPPGGAERIAEEIARFMKNRRDDG